MQKARRRGITPTTGVGAVPSRHRGRRALLIGVSAIAIAVFAAAYRHLWPFLVDDVFISLRYARNLSEGRGLVWNPGERVEGYTNFLWTVLLVPGFRPPFGIVPWVKWMNAAWALLAFVLTWRLAVRFAEGGREADGAPSGLWSLLPAAATLASVPFVLSAAEGLETMMFTSLGLLALLWSWEAEEAERVPRVSFALAGLAMTRPEGALVLPWMLVVLRLRGRTWGFLLRTVALFALLFGTYFAARWAWYGDPLPNTFYAKRGGDAEFARRGLQEVGSFLGRNGGWVWLLAIPALWDSASRPAAVAALGMPLVRVLFVLWSGGAWMGRDRFLVPALPHVLLLLAIGARVVLRRAPAASTALALGIVLVAGWLHWPEESLRALAYGEGLRRAHLRLGTDIAAHTRPDAVIAMDDAGMTPLVAGRTVIDMLGLNDRHIAHLPGRFTEKFDNDYVLGRRPDLVVLLTHTPPDSLPVFRLAGHLDLFRRADFRDSYAFSREYVFGPNYHLLVHRRVVGARVDTTFWSTASGPPADVIQVPR